MLNRFGWPVPEEPGHFLKFAIFTIIPRLILAMAFSLLFAGIDNYISLNEVIVFFILFCFLTFYILPPSVDTLFIIKKSTDKEVDDIVYLKLLKACKDSYEGIYTFRDSLVIKSFYGKAIKYYQKLKEKHPFEGYDVSHQVKPLRSFNEQYCQLLENSAWKFIENKYATEVVRYDISSLDTIRL